jgi:2-polyprenyl-3-methyl-5-hydroxy-6-metoxy-1,4-benzoquinol methylase
MKNRKLVCRACLSEAYFYLSHPEADLFRCNKCDHCFSDVNSMENQENYEENYFLEEHKNWFQNPNIKLFNKIKAFIYENNLCSVLDVGCGKGDLLRYLRDSDIQNALKLHGVDKTNNKDENSIKYYVKNIYDFSIDKKYDLTTSLAVIEHVEDVKEFMDHLIKYTKPGAYILVMTLNERSLLYEFSRILNFFLIKYPFQRLYSKHHLNHFNRQSLRQLGLDKNLEIISHLDHNIPFAAIDFEAKNKLVELIFKIGVYISFIIGKILKKSYLQTIIFRLPKN